MNRIWLGASLMVIAGTIPPAAAQQAPAQTQALQAQALQAQPGEIVAAVRKSIRENYVIAATRKPLDDALAKGLASGRYAVTDSQELAKRINDDMDAVAHDKHLGMHFDPKMAAEMAKSGDQNDEVTDSAFFKKMARQHNHGVSELRVLEGNVRLLKYEGFMWTGPESAAVIDSAMAFLRQGDAIVIDLRTNGGGSPDAVRRIASYFVPAGKKLVTFHMRSEPPTTSVSEAVPGGLIEGVPVYVLTSERSASAAEEFASHVAGFKFGTLVGETTAGAGYRNDTYPIPGGFVLSVSVGRPELPDGSDWEAKGVAPGIAVAQDLALARAQQAAFETLAAKAEGPERAALEWLAKVEHGRIAPPAPTLPLAAFAGRYGPRVVTVENGALHIQRDGRPRWKLVPVEPDLFALDLDTQTRVRFASANGAVTSMIMQRPDGSQVEEKKN
jgi:hypothetical protein